jgi:AraC family transcriptional regulator
MIVQYRNGETPMDREFDGKWTRTNCGPGHFSLLSRSADSHWSWTEGLVVSHIYLSNRLMHRVARDIKGEDVAQVHLHDVLQGEDPVISHIADQITAESMGAGEGGALYAEALSVQLAVHLLRHYASCSIKSSGGTTGFTQSELARLDEFIDAHLHDPLTIEDMAGLFGMGAWTFNRRLRRTIRLPAWALVQKKRLERAQTMLRGSDAPIKQIAAACGFSDQAHMTRMFRTKLNVTPGRYRGGA